MQGPLLDRYDIAILAVLQQDNTTPQRTIGERVNLSAAAVQRRIRRLEADGVIRGNVALVEPALVDRPLTLLVQVELESETLELIAAAKREFATAEEVQQCYYVTGEADFMLVILVASMAEYEALTKRLFFGNNNVRRFRTFVCMDRVKAGMTVALPA